MCSGGEGENAYLEEGVLLLALELVGAEKFETAIGLVISKTGLVALKELEDVVDNDGLEVDLLLVVQILGLELDLGTRINVTKTKLGDAT